MFQWTFIDTNGVLGTELVLEKVPQWITMTARTTSAPFGTYIDNNWNWTCVSSIAGNANPVGIYQLTYTNPLTGVTSALGAVLLPTDAASPPVLSLQDAAVPVYFSYTPPSTTTGAPTPGMSGGYITAYMAATSTGTATDSQGRVYPTFTASSDGTYPEGTQQITYQIGDIGGGDSTSSITAGSFLGLYVAPTPTTDQTNDYVRYFYCDVANQTSPTTPTTGANGATNDPANNTPANLVLTGLTTLTPTCTYPVPQPSSAMLPPSAASTSNSSNKTKTNIGLIIVIIAIILIVIIIAVIVIISMVNSNKKQIELQKRINTVAQYASS